MSVRPELLRDAIKLVIPNARPLIAAAELVFKAVKSDAEAPRPISRVTAKPQQMQFPTDPRHITRIMGVIRHHAGYSHIDVLKKEHLDNPEMRNRLQDRVLRSLERDPSYEHANEWLILTQLSRYVFPHDPNEEFFDAGLRKFQRNISIANFHNLALYRLAEHNLRVDGDNHVVGEEFIEISDRYKTERDHWSIDYFNSQRRVAEYYINIGNVDAAYNVLAESIKGLSSGEFKVDEQFSREIKDVRFVCLGNHSRALAVLLNKYGEFRDASKFLDIALQLYHRADHAPGFAAVAREKGLMLRAKGLENYHEGNLWLRRAERLFIKVGDKYRADHCREFLDDNADSQL